ncbi:MAG: hypothetical protein GF350_05030 [Chitinivibrionales bacterium]|nr:hypothetical protein [Chitinivibrionales bacterium]
MLFAKNFIFLPASFSLLIPYTLYSQGTVSRQSIQSSFVSNDMAQFRVYLPENYEHSSEQYPVVYHLHGVGGSDSSEICITKYVDSLVAAAYDFRGRKFQSSHQNAGLNTSQGAGLRLCVIQSPGKLHSRITFIYE